MSCPNKNTVEWKSLAYAVGENKAMDIFRKNGNELPTMEFINSNYSLSMDNRVVSSDTKNETVDRLISIYRDRLGVNIQVDDKISNAIIKQYGESAKNAPGYYNHDTKTVHLIKGKITNNTLLHEISHPIVDAIYENNKELYNSLVEEIKKDEDWYNRMSKSLSSKIYDNQDKIDRELITTLLGKTMSEYSDYNETMHKTLWDKIIDFIKDLLHMDFHVRDLNKDMSINDLSYLIKYGSGRIDLEIQNNNIKPGVQEIFEQNPELASIGTEKQYSAYLDTIFPDSKVKEIDNSLYISVLEDLKSNKIIEKQCP